MATPCSVERARFHPIKGGQVIIQHHLLTANQVNAALDSNGESLFLHLGFFSGIHAVLGVLCDPFHEVPALLVRGLHALGRRGDGDALLDRRKQARHPGGQEVWQVVPGNHVPGALDALRVAIGELGHDLPRLVVADRIALGRVEQEMRWT